MPAIEVVAGQSMLRQPARTVKAARARREWGYGAMGCARWKGARLKDVLDKVGLEERGD
jgi:DMSO/TMAO reductase YedYZ molybdopterin-dependent catalytic subunit